MDLTGVLEGLLFVSGEDGISLETAMSILETDEPSLMKLLKNLEEEYSKENRGLRLDLLGNKVKLTTKKEHKEYYAKMLEEDDSVLSQAALETLAIVAYNQPITRVKVDEIRGISSSHMIRKLLSRNLIKELGRSDLPGRPNLYGVTDEFLDYFGLASVEELPTLQENINLSDEEENLFETRYNEEK